MTKKRVWLQAGFRLLGLWFFLDGALSLGLRLTPALFPGKFYSFSFPANLFSLLAGAALFFAAPRLAALPLFAGGGEGGEEARWKEGSFLRVLFPVAGVYMCFKFLPMTPALVEALLRKGGDSGGPNLTGLRMLLSFGAFLGLVWYFLKGAPGIGRLLGAREDEEGGEGEDLFLSRRDALECLLRVFGSMFSIQVLLILLQAVWGGWAPPYLWGVLGGTVLAGALGVFLLVRADLAASLLLRGEDSAGKGSMPRMAAFLEAAILALGFWFLAKALISLSQPLFMVALGAGSFLKNGEDGSWWAGFWGQYGGSLTNLAFAVYLLADTRRQMGKILGRESGEDPGAEGPLLPRERAGTVFLLGCLLLGVYLVGEVLYGLPIFLAVSMSQWIFLVVLPVAALLLFFGGPILSNLFFRPGGEGGLPPRPAFSILDPLLRFLGIWLVLQGLMALPASLGFWAGAPQGGTLFVSGILQDLFGCFLGGILLFAAPRVMKLLPGAKAAPVSLPREEGAA